MGLALRPSAALSIVPVVRAGEHWLSASTHPAWTALSLCSYRRQLFVDARLRRIYLRERRRWRTLTRVLAFDEVERIDCELEARGSARRWARPKAHAPRALGSLRVGLVLNDGERVPLFCVIGDGRELQRWLRASHGEPSVDGAGMPGRRSLELLRHLARLTELPLGPKLPVGVDRYAAAPSSRHHAAWARSNAGPRSPSRCARKTRLRLGLLRKANTRLCQ